eukprot:7487151-Alexandrium_andersonii.AAC.1
MSVAPSKGSPRTYGRADGGSSQRWQHAPEAHNTLVPKAGSFPMETRASLVITCPEGAYIGRQTCR